MGVKTAVSVKAEMETVDGFLLRAIEISTGALRDEGDEMSPAPFTRASRLSDVRLIVGSSALLHSANRISCRAAGWVCSWIIRVDGCPFTVLVVMRQEGIRETRGRKG